MQLVADRDAIEVILQQHVLCCLCLGECEIMFCIQLSPLVLCSRLVLLFAELFSLKTHINCTLHIATSTAMAAATSQAHRHVLLHAN